MASSPLLHRSLPLLRFHLPPISPLRRFTSYFSTLEAFRLESSSSAAAKSPPPPATPASEDFTGKSWAEHPDYRRWKDQEEAILEDIGPITLLTKEILHSDRYMDGECLCPDDEKEVVEKLLTYHPRSEDKIGCGFNSIMVDHHPTFRNSRCLFVVRTDGGWIDFSYQKCLRAYIREKYPSYAERFIREYFKRT